MAGLCRFRGRTGRLLPIRALSLSGILCRGAACKQKEQAQKEGKPADAP